MKACDKLKKGQVNVSEITICVSLACNGTIVLPYKIVERQAKSIGEGV